MPTSSVCKLEVCKTLALINTETHYTWFVNHSIQITLREELSYANPNHIKTMSNK